MFLITSGAYISQEFASELGCLPPSFLPLGNRCLYEYQIALAEPLSDDIYLSIPESFELSDYEQAFIAEHSVKLITVPEGLSLGESVLYCLNMAQCGNSQLQILHGDTLFQNLPKGNDLVSISPNSGYYRRALSQQHSAQLLDEQLAVGC
ncbi:hypothetical protein [Motiliproteus sp.]|uniref:hypothetical protein n=1 Tax=Motiliproteus sp. TaxID=1898955 RepID=UPI003BA9BC74